MLQIAGVGHNYCGIPVLSDISVSIDRGVTGLIGPNGGGKSTLLNIISGALKPSSGAIWFDGANLALLPPHEVSRRGIARMFQGPRISHGLNVFENINLGLYSSHGAMRVRWPNKTADMVRDAATRCTLDERSLKSFPDELSFFECRMIELARCIVSPAIDLILLDEPAAGFTDEERRRVAGIISSLGKNKTVILVEHDLDLVQTVCDRVVILSGGKVLSTGHPASALQEPAVIEAYIGRKHVAG